MYASFFGLKQEPFSIAPDPRYLFMSERHREALAHLLYGVNGGGGFVLLSGEIGAGKTTVCRCFLEQIPKRTNVAYILNPKLTVIELLQSVCEEYNIPMRRQGHGDGGETGGAAAAPPTVKDYLDPLNEFLLRTHAIGQNNVLVIDEAQMLSADVLEQLRLLTNLETSERKLLQIILIGQPELRDLIARPELEQLAQRVIARYHLGALTEAETRRYVRHRLAVAGLKTAMPFDPKVMQRIHQLSRGVPRRINLLCDRALLGAYSAGKGSVDRAIVDKAASEVFDRERPRLGNPAVSAASGTGASGAAGNATSSQGRPRRGETRRLALWSAVGGAAVALVLVSALLWWQPGRQRPVVTAASTPAASGAGLAVAASGASAAGAAASATVAAAAPVKPASAAATAPPVFLTPDALQTRVDSSNRSEREGWGQLAALWKLALPADGDPCAAAAKQRIECYRSSDTNLALIRQLDRPGLLTLRDKADKPFYVLLTGLGADTATLQLGKSAESVTLVSLATLWRGDFATLWREPPGYADKTVDANSGVIASWVAAQLASFNKQPLATTDVAWRQQVADFQRSQALKPDGLVGPTTFMQLNRAIGVDEPRLRDGAGAPP